jgi:DNA replication protein DnaC
METLMYQLKSIRLSAMAQKLAIRIQEADANELSYLDFLKNLVEDELAVRKDRLLARRLKQANFPFFRTIEEFDFSFNPAVNKKQIKQLESCAFITQNQNVLIIGPPGVGKTHLSVAFGISAIQKGFSVIYYSTFDISKYIAKNPDDDILNVFMKPDLLIIDELGMKNLSPQATEALLETIHRRYQKASTIIASNRPVEDWGKILGDNATASAMLDRFLENINFIKIVGRSFRMKNISKNLDLNKNT